MKKGISGLDFGTSNSAISAGLFDGANNGDMSLIPLENGKDTIPSAIFFNMDENSTVFGRKAVDEYIEGFSGRFMRSLKSVLGSDLMADKTQIGRKSYRFDEIIGLFIQHLKQQSETHIGAPIDDVVVGRPVYFVDHNPAADQNAQDQLENIIRAQGFKHISFEYEPIAAAKTYEAMLTKEELVLVIDIGGGTSDFSLIRLSPELKNKEDRSQDILANSGIHIGGTDFDKAFSLSTVMPEMGYQTISHDKIELPKMMFHLLATWHHINQLYKRENWPSVKELHAIAIQKHLTSRFVETIENHRGHELANAVELAKIALSDHPSSTIKLDFIENNWQIISDQAQLNHAISAQITKIMDIAAKMIATDAGIATSDINAIYMTGGSTGLFPFTDSAKALFPQATIIHGDRFSSVATGLGLTAEKRYR